MKRDEIVDALDALPASTDRFGYVPRKSVAKLSALLATSEEFRHFEGLVHWIGDGGISFHVAEELAQRLARRAQAVGAEQTYDEMKSYIIAKDVHLFRAYLLHNIHLDEQYTFSNGVRISPIQQLPRSQLKEELLRRRFDYFIGGGIHSVILTEFIHEKAVRGPSDQADWTRMVRISEVDVVLNDTRLILSLARPVDFGIPVIAATTIVPDHLSFLSDGAGYNLFAEPRTMLNPEIVDIEMQQADRLIAAFERLDEHTKNRFRIALKRLNDTKIDTHNWVNKAINLRICLENLFLNAGETTEIRRHLSERVPKHTSFTKTRTQKAYSFLSAAVHSGEIQHHPTIRERDIAAEIQKVLRQFISAGGYPVWNNRANNGRAIGLLGKIWMVGRKFLTFRRDR